MRRCCSVVLASVVAATGAAAPASAAPKGPAFARVDTLGVGPIPSFGMTRTGDGALHLVFQTAPAVTSAADGLATRTISAAGALSAPVTALSGWNAGRPGLVALPGGALEAIFGAISPANVSSVWGVTSSDGGATWAAPVDVRGGDNEALAYGSDVTAAMAGATPVITLPQAGNLVVQRGLGAGSPTEQVSNAGDGSVGDVNTAADGTGQVVAAWQSLAGNGADVLQAIGPGTGAAQVLPGQLRNQVVVAGRDVGAGVFAATTPDNRHVRLVRYGGGSVAVGSIAGVTAKVLGTATGPGGRIWALWGDDDTMALTRSNKADTRFEPIQRIAIATAALARLSGDGRLGPLDLLVDEIPKKDINAPGTFHARVLPVLSAKAAVTKIKKSSKHKLRVTVTDAGDPVAGATVKAAGKKATTNGKGVASLVIGGGGHVSAGVTAAGYQPLELSLKV